MDLLQLDQFSDSVGESFEVSTGTGTVQLRLEKADALVWSKARDEHGFRLEWSGPQEPLLPQATYPFRRGDRAFEIFIVPIAESQGQILYEAIFN